jgi:signal transduction histidine kinase
MSERRTFVHDMKNYLGIVIGYSNLVLDDMPADDPRRADIEEIRQAGENALAVIERWTGVPPGEGGA